MVILDLLPVETSLSCRGLSCLDLKCTRIESHIPGTLRMRWDFISAYIPVQPPKKVRLYFTGSEWCDFQSLNLQHCSVVTLPANGWNAQVCPSVTQHLQTVLFEASFSEPPGNWSNRLRLASANMDPVAWTLSPSESWYSPIRNNPYLWELSNQCQLSSISDPSLNEPRWSITIINPH